MIALSALPKVASTGRPSICSVGRPETAGGLVVRLLLLSISVPRVKSMLSSIMTLFIGLSYDLFRMARMVPIVRVRWVCGVCRRDTVRTSTFLNIEILDTRHVEPVPQQRTKME